MPDIQSSAASIRSVLKHRFYLGDYQREYEWTEKECGELLKDLYSAFEPRASSFRKEYFLGPILIKEVQGKASLIDGQQRLTSIALLLLAGLRQLRLTASGLANFSPGRPNESLAVQLFRDPIREAAFRQLWSDGEIIGGGETESERRMLKLFPLFGEFISSRIAGKELNEFLIWLCDNVFVAEVRVGGTYDAFSLFDAMNTRGKPLEALGQFTAFLAKSIPDETARNSALAVWRDTLLGIARYGSGAELEFLKVWMASRCLSVTGAIPAKPSDMKKRLAKSHMAEIDAEGPFFAMKNKDRIEALGLMSPRTWAQDHGLPFGEIYQRIRSARIAVDRELEGLYFVERLGFNLDLFDEILLLSTARVGSQNSLLRLQVAVQFIENMAARWAWNSTLKPQPAERHIDRLKYVAARAATEVREAKDPLDMARRLQALHAAFRLDFTRNPDLSNPLRGKAAFTHPLLARMTAFLEEIDGRPGTYKHYQVGVPDDPFEVEHLLPNQFRSVGSGRGALEQARELGHNIKTSKDYAVLRQRLGALVLLPKSQNLALSDKPYAAKRNFYAANAANILVRTLFGGDNHSVPIKDFLRSHDIEFPNAQILDREIIQKRQQALVRLAEATWSSDRLADRAQPQAQ